MLDDPASISIAGLCAFAGIILSLWQVRDYCSMRTHAHEPAPTPARQGPALDPAMQKFMAVLLHVLRSSRT